MSVLVRSLTEQDDLEALNEGNYLGWWTSLWKSMETDGGLPVHWFAADLDGRPVGMGVVAALPVAAGGNAAGMINVVPAARRRGVGAALRRAVEDTVRGAVPGLQYSFDVRSTDSAAAAQAWGLPVVARHAESVLDLTALSDRVRARGSVEGVEIRSLPDLETMTEEDWASIHAFAQDRFREAPDARDGGGELPFEVFRGLVTEAWMLFEAIQDGERIGLTFVCARPTGPETVNTYFTGVTEAARGRGVAMALKVTQASRMAERGLRSLYTQNMHGNDPILAANRALGFVPDSEYVDVVVDLAD